MSRTLRLAALALASLTVTTQLAVAQRLTLDDEPLTYVPLDGGGEEEPPVEPTPSEAEAQCHAKCQASYDTCANNASYAAALCIDALRVKSRLGEITDDQYDVDFDLCLANLTQKQTECLTKLELCQAKCEAK